jgi:hypothetical protein
MSISLMTETDQIFPSKTGTSIDIDKGFDVARSSKIRISDHYSK